jgi:hypothetical protein
MMKEYIVLPLLFSVLATPALGQTYKCEIDGKIKSVGMPCDQYLKFFNSSNKNLIIQKSTPKQTRPIEAETNNTIIEDSAPKKSWLEKREEERNETKDQRKADHKERVKAASDSIRFKKLIWNKQIAVGMSETEVRKSWGSPTKINHRIDSGGSFDQWVYRTYKKSQFTGTDYVYFQNGKVTSIDY